MAISQSWSAGMTTNGVTVLESRNLYIGLQKWMPYNGTPKCLQLLIVCFAQGNVEHLNVRQPDRYDLMSSANQRIGDNGNGQVAI